MIGSARVNYDDALSNTVFPSNRIRGRLGSVFVFSTGTGILFAYTCGTVFNYKALPFIYIPLSVLFLLGALLYPESAHYLVQKNKNDVSDKQNT